MAAFSSSCVGSTSGMPATLTPSGMGTGVGSWANTAGRQ